VHRDKAVCSKQVKQLIQKPVQSVTNKAKEILDIIHHKIARVSKAWTFVTDNASSLTKELKDTKEGRLQDVKHVEKVFQRQQVMLMDPYGCLLDPVVDATKWHVSGVLSSNHNFFLSFFFCHECQHM